ncbi:glycoside hydrolase family 99-like domain-containing protein [Vibrio barjaei]|uniref:glycosyltransferase WbsX family protein n=1 Tax=Vibrio barjaei TaxID=1676683 RepID=UPI00228447A5|nr:glycoside hydrolase family 99-like domain-containing protein [Vibrio barjaei]MCY9872548.1 glycoside hydrolase family 99-like domain-containing protein [Vibrio barjaei]
MTSKIKPIAFYLPQFHRVEDNDKWWGKGFTEWTNVAKAKPNFEGHYQPHIPREMGFYDLDNVERMREQADLAKQHGLHGFCFYYYRFKDGKRILERPLDKYVESDIDFPYCFCWANENWTKTWDGLDKEILLEQNHGGKDDIDFLIELLPIFNDDRYIKVDGKPVVLVYRADLFKDAKVLTQKWRELAREAGFPDLHLCAVQFYGIDDPTQFGFDAAVEFPPHTFIGPENRPSESIDISNPNFTGGIVDYRKVLSQAINKPNVDYVRYRGIIPSWDNTARRQDTGHILVNSSPSLYRFWLSYIASQTQADELNPDNFLFVNAWNEWAEGAHLEPDMKYGLGYLEATLAVVNQKKLDIRDYVVNENILNFILQDMNSSDIAALQKAFNLSYHQDNTVENIQIARTEGTSDFVKFRRKFVQKFPKLSQKILPLYLKLRKVK